MQTLAISIKQLSGRGLILELLKSCRPQEASAAADIGPMTPAAQLYLYCLPFIDHHLPGPGSLAPGLS